MALSNSTDTELIAAINARANQPGRRTGAGKWYAQIMYPPVTLAQIEAAERGIGFRLPDLVRDLYMQVGNGGFGPGYGIIGLEGGYPVYTQTLVGSVHSFRMLKERLQALDRRVPDWDWGVQWMVYGFHGSNITTVLDCADPSLLIYSLDALTLQPHPAKTLRQWWHNWLSD